MSPISLSRVERLISPEKAEFLDWIEPYAQQVNLDILVNVEYRKYPPPMRLYGATYNWPENIVRFYFDSPERLMSLSRQELLAILAHEAGHVEQNVSMVLAYPIGIPRPFLELDAWKRGARWAEKWGISNEYRKYLAEGLTPIRLIGEDFIRAVLEVETRLRRDLERRRLGKRVDMRKWPRWLLE